VYDDWIDMDSHLGAAVPIEEEICNAVLNPRTMMTKEKTARYPYEIKKF
jgi:hypothetical protein